VWGTQKPSSRHKEDTGPQKKLGCNNARRLKKKQQKKNPPKKYKKSSGGDSFVRMTENSSMGLREG